MPFELTYIPFYNTQYAYFGLKSTLEGYLMEQKVYNRIKAVLAEQSKPNKWLAQKLNVNPNTVSKWCTNQMQPTIESLFKIAVALDVNVRELLVSTK